MQDEAEPRTRSVLASLDMDEAIVPGIWPLEVANVLAVCERRNRLSADKVAAFVSMLEKYPITVDEQTAKKAFGEVLSLARSHRLTAYDAAYLELALRHRLPVGQSRCGVERIGDGSWNRAV